MNSAKSQIKTFTTNDGVRLNYSETGSGKPLVLIHGWSQCAEEFKHQVAGLSDRYRVIAYDQRGHGESAKPGFGYTAVFPKTSMKCSFLWTCAM